MTASNAPRKPLVVGNWKMNTDRAGALALANEVAQGTTELREHVVVGVCPPFVYLDAVVRDLRASGYKLHVGAQDVSPEPNGALTGEVSVAMLEDLSVEFSLTGHSERRHVIGESDELVGRKTAAALSAGHGVILCVGETLDQRKAGQTDAVNERQLRTGLAGVAPEHLPILSIAYEPVWAIGTGNTATPQDAQRAHMAVRSVIADLFGADAAGQMRILYGGSVKPDNARELFACPDIDGGLIGGASLKAAPFIEIAVAAAESR
ncbi:MAG: triose-phosphate isomerase [Phycisphaerales bacterium]|nr:triose-phosphate isomerase [Phycisphaerales bacterium]